MAVARPYDPDFYVIIATVLPIALLALTISGFRAYGIAGFFRLITKPGPLETIRVVLALLIVAAIFLVPLDMERRCFNAIHAQSNLSSWLDGFMVFVTIFLLAINAAGIAAEIIEKIVISALTDHPDLPEHQESDIKPDS